MSVVFKRGRAEIEANLTPMIDVTFLLIIFFVLVSQIVDIERVDMDLPKPDDPASARAAEDDRAVINVLPGPEGSAAGYRVGTRTFAADADGRRALARRLVELHRANPDVNVHLRADRATQYQHIDPVFDVIRQAARDVGDRDLIARVQLVILREE